MQLSPLECAQCWLLVTYTLSIWGLNTEMQLTSNMASCCTWAYVHTSLLSPFQGCRPLCGEFKTVFGWEVTQVCGGLGQRVLNTTVTNIYLLYNNVIEGPWYLMTSMFTDSSTRKLEGGGVGRTCCPHPSPSNMPTYYEAKIFPAWGNMLWACELGIYFGWIPGGLALSTQIQPLVSIFSLSFSMTLTRSRSNCQIWGMFKIWACASRSSNPT